MQHLQPTLIFLEDTTWNLQIYKHYYSEMKANAIPKFTISFGFLCFWSGCWRTITDFKVQKQSLSTGKYIKDTAIIMQCHNSK
jgi:hypothetical protein